MRIAILLGRGVEGCGCTKNAIEFAKFVPSTKIFAITDKQWPRKNSLTFEKIEFKAEDLNQCKNVITVLNSNFDVVIIFSVPSKDHSEECIDNFIKLIQHVNIVKVGLQVDHNIHSIIRNAKFDIVCNNLDLLMTHSLTNDFCKWAKKQNVITPIVTASVGFSFDEHRKKYWTSIEEQNAKVVRWIGRTALWKGPDIIIDFHNEMLKQHSYITILEGLEAGINYVQVTYKDAFKMQQPRDVLNFFRPMPRKQVRADLHGKEKINNFPYLYTLYNNHECMERMKYSAFGSDLFHLKNNTYGNNIEYCHAECIASGTIPIFHKHFGDSVIHRIQSKPCTECKNTGTIFLDRSNFKECCDIMLKLSNDNKMRDEWREMSFEFWKQHADANIVVNDIINKIKTIRR